MLFKLENKFMSAIKLTPPHPYNHVYEIQPGWKWMEEYLHHLQKQIQEIAFYKIVSQTQSIAEFSWVKYLYYHSMEFPRILALRMALSSNPLHKEFNWDHLITERGHAELLIQWMVQHDHLPIENPIVTELPTVATIASLSHGYRLIMTDSFEAQVIGLNTALESASHHMFSTLTPILTQLGAGSSYWHIHTELDQFHSTEGLNLLDPVSEKSVQGEHLKQVVFETLTLWGAMLNSWVGVNEIPVLE
jgi:hypothetical protein